MNGYSNGQTISGSTGDSRYYYDVIMTTSAAPYYEPLIEPTAKIGRHLFWSNYHIETIDIPEIKGIFSATPEELKKQLGFNYKGNIYYKGNHDGGQVLRNCVHPKLGLHVLNQVNQGKANRKVFIQQNQIKARAIELNDTATLKKLPEIGGKTAQKIVVELKGKAAKFALLREEELPTPHAISDIEAEYQLEAVEILKQLQYSETEAHDLVHHIAESNPDITTAEELIQEIFKKQMK